MKNKKIVSLISGGMDSCTVVGKLAIEGYEVFPIYIDYGQKVKKKELSAVRRYLNFLEKKYTVHNLIISKVSLPFLRIPMLGYGKIPKYYEDNFLTLSSKKIDYVLDVFYN
ncbi:MAG: 7-cyano-7-deazaguanine synthase [Candidatus Aenigmarchaeota archaeon]|nr:7-cyano-7-deazaguanine synthase [Candidatus Aenigmarchaeota archaeon]